MSDASPLRDIGECRVRLTEQEAQLNLRMVLELCAAGELRCSEKTSRPSAATVRTVEEHLPPEGRQGVGQLPTRGVDQCGRPVHDHATGQHEPHHRP